MREIVFGYWQGPSFALIFPIFAMGSMKIASSTELLEVWGR